jgi:hypothetical protein
MKRSVVFLVLGTLAALWLSAEPVTIVNGEDTVLYYAVTPFDGTVLPTMGEAMALLGEAEISNIPPGSAVQEARTRGSYLLLGCYGSGTCTPVALVFNVAAEQKLVNVSLDASVEPSEDDDPRLSFDAIGVETPPVVVDGTFAEWDDVPDLVRFAPSFRPAVFTRETRSAVSTLSVDRSFYWKKSGTGLERVKGLRTGDYLYFLFSSASPMTDGLSYFLYFYLDRESGTVNRYTVELMVREGVGYVLLWTEGAATPQPVGSYIQNGYLLEARIRLDALPEVLQVSDDVSADLTSCFFDSGLYEEFFFTTMHLRDLYPEEELRG